MLQLMDFIVVGPFRKFSDGLELFEFRGRHVADEARWASFGNKFLPWEVIYSRDPVGSRDVAVGIAELDGDVIHMMACVFLRESGTKIARLPR